MLLNWYFCLCVVRMASLCHCPRLCCQERPWHLAGPRPGLGRSGSLKFSLRSLFTQHLLSESSRTILHQSKMIPSPSPLSPFLALFFSVAHITFLHITHFTYFPVCPTLIKRQTPGGQGFYFGHCCIPGAWNSTWNRLCFIHIGMIRRTDEGKNRAYCLHPVEPGTASGTDSRPWDSREPRHAAAHRCRAVITTDTSARHTCCHE